MKKTISTAIALFALSCFLSPAQKFNPKVEVENTYEGKVVEVSKKPVTMTVPDSLYKFRYTLDYSVFDNPYQGSYDFHPYKIEMKPDAMPSGRRKLFASLGAGYSLHPELDVVYSPEFRKTPLILSVYDSFRSFFGNYAVPEITLYKSPVVVCSVSNKAERNNPGFVLDNKVGADLRYEFSKLAIEYDGGYRLMGVDDKLVSHQLHLFENELRLLPLDPNKSNYFYGATLRVNAGKDIFSSLMTGPHKLGVNDMGFNARFGFPISHTEKALGEMGIQTIVYSGAHEAAITKVWFTPRYSFAWDGGSAALGVKVSALIGNDISSSMGEGTAFQHKSRILYPAVSVKHFLVPGHLSVYLKADGGDYLNCYSESLAANPFFNPKMVVPYFDSSSERVNARLGLSGSAWGRLQYDIHGGYALLDNWMCESAQVLELASDTSESGYDMYLSSYFNYCDFTKIYADASVLWQSPRVDVDAHVRYTYTDLAKEGWICLNLPAWTGEIRASYNWNRQAYAGVSVRGQSERRGYFRVGSDMNTDGAFSVSGFIDLGLFGSYAINPSWTVWLKSGNLLGQCVQTYFLHPERGPYVTVGASFNL